MVSEHSQPAKVLTIGGSDSGGAAGIQADLKTLTMLGVYAMSAITVVTAQNSLTVAGVHKLPPEFLASQLDAVLSDYGAEGTKTGFIGDTALIEVISAKIETFQLENVVIDPVLVNHRGESMFPEVVTKATNDRLLPLARLITPNVREAELLSGLAIADAAGMRAAANRLFSRGCDAVLITGWREGADVVDLLFDGENMTLYRSPRIDSANRHGSGDTLSAAICAFLSLGVPLLEAVDQARAFTYEAVRKAKDWRLGAGHGPVSFWGNVKGFPKKHPGSKEG